MRRRHRASGAPPRVALLAQAFPPQNNPEAIVNGKLALALLGAGWQVEIVTRGDRARRGQGSGGAWEQCWEPLAARTHDVRYPLTGRAGRLIDVARAGLRGGYPLAGCRWAWHAARAVAALHRERPLDAILSRGLPDTTHLAGRLAARQTGLALAANWNDPPLHLFPPPQEHRLGPVARLFHERLALQAAREASLLTFPSERLARHVCRWLGESAAEKSAVVPHAALAPVAAGPRPRGGCFTLCHAGNLFAGRDPAPLLDGLRELASRRGEAVRLVHVGDADAALVRAVRRRGLAEAVTFAGRRPYLETQRLLAEADVLVVVEAAYAEGIFLPSKFVDYVQCGRPILALSPRAGTLADVLGTHGGGLAADCASPRAVFDALALLHAAWERGSLQRDFGSEQLQGLYSAGTVAAAWGELLARIPRGTAERERG